MLEQKYAHNLDILNREFDDFYEFLLTLFRNQRNLEENHEGITNKKRLLKEDSIAPLNERVKQLGCHD